jgi:hypothetical protein
MNIKVNTNIAEVSGRIRAKLEKVKDKETLLRPLCFDLVEIMTKRIHTRGENSSGSQIGTYSNPYLKYRERGDPKNNVPKRGSDSKIVVSLTRELENDWSVIATPNGYGIGFKNVFNLQKARWVEVMKGVIFSLTSQENKYASDFINHHVNEALSSND